MITYAKHLWARIRQPQEQVTGEWMDQYIERSLAVYDEIERVTNMPSPERPDRRHSGPDTPRPLPKFARVRR